ncbi:NF-kappa-B inhibitor epsilon [Denticeps clupeoides]|uniref:Uncharacterized protein n=1 Tax=Denticeps clupeoides TaxID=299321 RepID=A0AAY4CCE5_9TELE|nr:NF-kappa-B inhibitor epsilon [Denticeps clupeoides]
MASREEARGKGEPDEFRADSGVDSYRSLAAVCRSGAEPAADGAAEERHDSAYGSASLSVESLGDILKTCAVPAQRDGQEAEPDLAAVTDDGDTTLHLAIIHEDEGLADALIRLFPKELLDIQNDLYQTPLHLATYLNLSSLVRSLVQHGANLAMQDQDGNTPLHVACEHGRAECVSELTHNIPPTQLAPVLEAQNWKGVTCLHLATMHQRHRLMKLLIKKGADLNIQEGTSGKTPLHMAVELHDVTGARLLLAKGANVDVTMFNGCTPLHLAVGRQDTAIADLLCQSGADKMIRNIEDETALDLADGNDDILALFPFDDIQISGRSVLGVQF